jgi:hypothetical protein
MGKCERFLARISMFSLFTFFRFYFACSCILCFVFNFWGKHSTLFWQSFSLFNVLLPRRNCVCVFNSDFFF